MLDLSTELRDAPAERRGASGFRAQGVDVGGSVAERCGEPRHLRPMLLEPVQERRAPVGRAPGPIAVLLGTAHRLLRRRARRRRRLLGLRRLGRCFLRGDNPRLRVPDVLGEIRAERPAARRARLGGIGLLGALEALLRLLQERSPVAALGLGARGGELRVGMDAGGELELREDGGRVHVGDGFQGGLGLDECGRRVRKLHGRAKHPLHVGEPGELGLERRELDQGLLQRLRALGEGGPLLGEPAVLLGLGQELDREVLDALAGRVDLGERLGRGMLHRGGLLQGGRRRLRHVLGLGRGLLRAFQLCLDRREVGHRARQLGRALLRGARFPASGQPRVVDRLDPEETQRHLAALPRPHRRERVKLLLFRVHGRAEHLAIHLEQAPQLRVHVAGSGGELETTTEQLGLGRVAPSPDRSPDLVRLARVLERHANLAIGQHAAGPDQVAFGPCSVDAVAGERDALHQRRLAAAVLAEDPDHARRQLELHLLEHPVVPERELEDPHTVSPRASSRNLVPSATTRSRSRPSNAVLCPVL